MDKIVSQAFEEAHTLRQSKKVGMRMAALMIGIRRVAEAAKIRGLYPLPFLDIPRIYPTNSRVLMKEKLRSQVKDRRTRPEKEDCPRGADCHGNDSTRRRRSWQHYQCNTQALENKFSSPALYLQA